MRVLGRIRLSRLTEESTSEDRQKESIEQWASLHGHEVIGWAVDLDVSGSISPFEAPALGPWLKQERLPEWDILCTYRLDRIARRVVPLNALFGLIMDNDKSLVSVSENIDLSHWVGRMVANVIAGVAEGELEAITERTRASRQKLRELGRWSGGTVPYGYTTVQRDGGWYFEPDEGDKAERVRWMFREATDLRSIRSIADELNEAGIPSPRNGAWTPQAITRILRSRWVIGQQEHKGKVVTDEEGMPVQRMEPLISYEEWKRCNGALDTRLRPKKQDHGTGLLLHVAYCGECGEYYYHNVMNYPNRNWTYRYWRCSGRYRMKNGCTADSAIADELEEFVEQHLLDEIGDIERTERVYMPAEDHETELAQIDDAIAAIRQEKDLGLYEGDNEGYISRLTKLSDRRKALKSLPTRESGFWLRGLGEIFRDAWDRMGTDDRREMLLNAGIKVYVKTKPNNFHVYVPEDIRERVA